MSTQAQPIVKTERDRYFDVVKILDTRKAEIQKALPQWMLKQAERMVRIALSTVHNAPMLLQCDPTSIYYSVLFACQQGLSLDPLLGHGYLVPFYNRHLYGKNKGGMECKFMPGYRGLIDLAMRSQKVLAIRANVVFAGDIFEYEEGLAPKLIHKPNPNSQKRLMEDCVAVYDVVQLKGVPREENPFHVMFREDVLRIRERSKGAWYEDDNTKERKLTGPWLTDWAEMWKKTPVRQHSKYLQLSPELTQLAIYDEYADRGLARTVYNQEQGRVEMEYVEEENGEDRKDKTPQRTPTTIDAQPKREGSVEVKTQPEPPVSQEPGWEDLQDAKPTKAEPPREPEQTKPQATAAETKTEPPKQVPGCITQNKITRLWAIFNSANKKVEAEGGAVRDKQVLYDFIKKQFGVSNLHEVKNEHYDALCKFAGGDALKV